jgi:hypothetical protein
MVVCGADFVMEVVVFCGTALFFFLQELHGRKKEALTQHGEGRINSRVSSTTKSNLHNLQFIGIVMNCLINLIICM